MTTPNAALDWLAGQEGAMLALLERLVNIDSNSYDKAGVDAVGEALEAFLAEHGVACERIPLEIHGDVWKASLPGRSGNAPVMLLGHRDTVFPKGEAVRRPFAIEAGRAYGPGVVDMKAGLVLSAFVLAAFARAGGAPAPLVGLFTSDEEIGTPSCRPIIESEARACRAVFNAEPGRVSGNVVTSRRGGVFFRARVFGKAAHAGLNFEEGHSAILEIARKTERWMALPQEEPGTTVNVGLIAGGQSVNTVAPEARCEIDLRYGDPADRERLIAKVHAIAQACSVEGTRGEIEIAGEFLPMAQSPAGAALFDGYVAAAGFTVDGEFTRSCADSGLTAAVGTPTLCAVGPVGGKAHSREEYVEIDTMVPRAQALAHAIARLA